MCGIVAFLSQSGAVDAGALQRATKSLHHRGPDAQHEWIDPRRRVGLGHARLGIIDLEGGDQPLANEDESIHAVVNGELYDFERIRAGLEAKGHRFRTRTDSEILLHLYEEFGPAFVEQLRGEFAFVLYDAKNDVLVAGRDRFGIKPLHYANVGDALVLASEAKALFAAGAKARWDVETFFLASMLGTPLEDRTFFADVKQVPPGHLLIATHGGTRLVRYWDFDYPLEPSKGSEAEHVEALSAKLDEAVRLRLRADVPVACYLSGGIDSCTVLGIASRYASSPIRAFTLAFDHDDYNEEAIAREMAAHAGADYTPIPVAQTDFARDFDDALFHAERPVANANGVAKFRLSRAVRDAGIKVVLTGEGSDEVFAGYPSFRRDLFLEDARIDAARARENLAELERTNKVSRGTFLPDGEALPVRAVRQALDDFAPTWLEGFATAGHKMLGLMSSAALQSRGERDPLALFMASLEVTRQLRGRHVVHQAMYLWSKSMLPNFILSVLGDRMEMAHSVEGRLPFLDHHVVELARTFPIDRLIRETTEKYVLREAAKPFVTDTVHRRQKHPFFAPPACSAGGPLHDLMQDTLRGAALKDVPFYAPKRIVGMLDALPSMDDARRTAVDSPLMIVLSTCLLQKRFGIADTV